MSNIIKPVITKSNKIVDINGNPLSSKPKYDHIERIQVAINMAIAENRVVRFLSDKANAQIAKEIENKRGCKIHKPFKESKEIAVIPPGIDDFCFEEAVDNKIIVSRNIL